MRILKLQVQISIDGYIAGSNGEMDWMEWNWDDELKSYVNDLTDSTGTILLGRKMADGFISHWESVTANPSDPQFTFAKKMVETPKVVFSRILAESSWNNTVVAKGDLVAEIENRKGRKAERTLSCMAAFHWFHL
jgi:dihydrofolate reductase